MLTELTGDQRRQLIDAQQAFSAWRLTDREFRHSYRGHMRWRRVGKHEYLYRVQGKVEKSQGPRSPETEQVFDDYQAQRARLRDRRRRLSLRLDKMERINRAHGLGRMPETAARVLRRLDEAGLLGNQIFVVGTHSLYAYEVKAGVRFETDLTTTTDLDLLVDARQHMSLAIADEIKPEGVLGVLRKADRSFVRTDDYQAINADGYYVDLIAPFRRHEGGVKPIRFGASEEDLTPVAILGLQWLINAPKFEEIVIGVDGRPLWMSCIDPRAFALHKFWVSRQADRAPIKRRRDAAQARAIALLASDYLSLSFTAKDLTALPLEWTRAAKDLIAAARREQA